MGAVFVFCGLSLLSSFFLGIFCSLLIEEGFDIKIFLMCICFCIIIISSIFGSYFAGVNTASYYCQECGYKTQNEDIQYCPNDGTKLEIFGCNTD